MGPEQDPLNCSDAVALPSDPTETPKVTRPPNDLCHKVSLETQCLHEPPPRRSARIAALLAEKAKALTAPPPERPLPPARRPRAKKRSTTQKDVLTESIEPPKDAAPDLTITNATELWDSRDSTGVQDDDRESVDDEIPDIEAMVIQHLPSDELVSHFQSANSLPTRAVGASTGSDLGRMLGQPKAINIPDLVQRALVKTTRSEHVRAIAFMRTSLNDELLSLPMSTAIVEMYTRAAIARKWRSTTLLKNLTTAQGALAILPVYLQAPQILLRNCPIWSQAIRAANISSRQTLPQQPKAATWSQVQQALDQEPSPPKFCTLLLSWISCARVGCILQLTTQDVTVHEDQTVTIRFRRGKAVRSRGPYSVHTAPVPDRYYNRLLKWLAQRRAWLFPKTCTGQQIKESLRKVDAQLEQRSIRRGALQTLAAIPGVTTEQLLLFSGHTTERMLLRYLNWGTEAVHQRRTMAALSNTMGRIPSAALITSG